MFSVRFVWDKLKGVRWKVIGGLILSVFYCFLGLAAPYLSKLLVDDAIRGGKTEAVVPLVGLMVGAVALRGLLFMLKVLWLEQASQTMLVEVRKSIFCNLQHQEMSFFDRIRTGDIITRVTGDLNYLRHFIAYVSYAAVDAVFIIAFSFGMFFCISPVLSLALLGLVPFMILTSLLYSRRVRPLYRYNRECLSKLNEGASENIDGNRAVKAFAREDYEKEKFDKMSRNYKDAQMRAAMANLRLAPVMAFFSQSVTVIAMLVGGLLALHGHITVGDLTLFVTVGGTLSAAITNIPNLINAIHQFHVSAQKVIEVSEAAPLICDRPDAVALPAGERLKGRIEFRDVTFTYRHGRTVLHDVSFLVESGETVAVMGPTGCGKTTLIDLLVRFYDVSSGAVLLDGVDVRMRRLEDIHRSVGIATQDVFLFSDTVDSNIAFSDVEMSEEAVKNYAKLADADGFIRELSDGYETIIGERGVGLSGGQRQRIALARALAAEPSVLVLDDTTSAVDMETEKVIQNSLRNLPFPCTKIIIAQRISSVRHADKIIILEDGHPVIGTHEELARTNAYYREVCELQDVAGLPPFEGRSEGKAERASERRTGENRASDNKTASGTGKEDGKATAPSPDGLARPAAREGVTV